MSTDTHADGFPGDNSKPWWLRVGCFVFLLILASMATPQQSRAAVIGTFVGVFSGNDDAGALETIFGLSANSLTQIGTVNDPQTNTTDGGLTLSAFIDLNNAAMPPTPVMGSWSTSPLTTFYIAVKDGSTFCINACASGDLTGVDDATGLLTTDGSGFAVYAFSGMGALDGMWTGEKFFNSSGNFKDVSHVAAYGVVAVPLPAALSLFLSALAGLGFFGWRRNRAAA